MNNKTNRHETVGEALRDMHIMNMLLRLQTILLTTWEIWLYMDLPIFS
ncbi:hypothetical protein [Lactobacillus apis]|nr:hypothetical protein [Lactobacillus apis]GGG31766.1 hypothetical protein GCM10007323_02160 [Lactobacillus apis]